MAVLSSKACSSKAWHFGTCSILLSLLVGCGGNGMVRVWGEVSYDAVPLENGTIIFTPELGTEGPSTGDRIVNGKYDVPAEKGALPNGKYLVRITSLRKNGKTIPNLKDPKNGPPEELSEQFLPDKYNTASELHAVIESGSTRLNFDLKP